MIDMAGKDIIPAVVRYTKELAEAAASVESLGIDAGVQRELLTRVTVLLRQVNAALADPCCKTNPILVEDFMVRRVLEEVTGRV